jgi:hypothetical protein
MLSRARATSISLKGSDRLRFKRIQMRGEGEEDLRRCQGVAVGVVRAVNRKAEAARN